MNIPGVLIIPFSKFEKLETGWGDIVWIYYNGGQYKALTAGQAQDVEEQIKAIFRAPAAVYHAPPTAPSLDEK